MYRVCVESACSWLDEELANESNSLMSVLFLFPMTEPNDKFRGQQEKQQCSNSVNTEGETVIA